MKIGLIIYGTLDTLSGGYLYDRQLVAYLRAAGRHVDILSLSWRTYSSHLIDNLRIEWARRIARGNYDLILQDELNHPSLFLLNFILRPLCTCPLVSIVHHLRSSEGHPPQFMPLYRAVERIYLRSVDGHVFNSKTTRRVVHRLVGHDMPHVVAYPAADHRQPPSHESIINAVAERLDKHGQLQLLFVGNIIARKGLHTVLNALARLESTSWHLHIVGSQDFEPDYSRGMHYRANMLSLTPRVTWHGRVNDQELIRLLSTSELLVMPSYEGFGIVFLEAMAYGLPVLAASVGAASELILPGTNGHLFAMNDDVTLAKEIDLLQGNRVQVAVLSYFARRRYEEHPTWEMSMKSILDWLRELPTKSRSL